MPHRGITKKAKQLYDDSRLIASILHHEKIGIEALTISLLRDLSSPAAQIIMESYPGSDLLGMAREISGTPIIDKVRFEKASPTDIRLPYSDAYRRLFTEIADFSRRLHHDSFATVHFPYAIVNILNNFHPRNGSSDGEKVREVFQKESKKWNSGLTSTEYMEAATTKYLLSRGCPVYGNVAPGVIGKDLFEFENN